jgi:hypothetical protein
MLESGKRIRRVDMVNTHSLLVPNMLESCKRIHVGVRGPTLMRMEMCTAVSGRMMSLSWANSPGMAIPGMEVWKMRKVDDRLV